MASRYFTLEEARGLVSWLEETFQALEPLRQRLGELHDEIRELQNSILSNGGGAVDEQLTTQRRDLDKTSRLIEERIQPIHERGILVKSIQRGLVDFPSIREGREVYLCWHAGEPEIQSWHEVDVGFAGGQPL